jgi:hypothetical protein
MAQDNAAIRLEMLWNARGFAKKPGHAASATDVVIPSWRLPLVVSQRDDWIDTHRTAGGQQPTERRRQDQHG